MYNYEFEEIVHEEGLEVPNILLQHKEKLTFQNLESIVELARDELITDRRYVTLEEICDILVARYDFDYHLIDLEESIEIDV